MWIERAIGLCNHFLHFQCKLQGPANTNSFFFTTLQDRFELSYLSLCIVRISHVLITKWCYSRGQQAESSSCWLLWWYAAPHISELCSNSGHISQITSLRGPNRAEQSYKNNGQRCNLKQSSQIRLDFDHVIQPGLSSWIGHSSLKILCPLNI